MDDTIYIVGGGPSLINFDWSKLQGKRTIAVNLAFTKIPDAEAIYFSDSRFWLWHKKALTAHLSPVYTGANIPGNDTKLIKYQFTGIEGLDTTPKKIKHGNSSGYAAMNLAYHLGAKRMVLLGYDLNDTTHWHEDHAIKSRPTSIPKMLKYFPGIVKPLEAEGVEVINANPDSAIDCFKKVSIDEVL